MKAIGTLACALGALILSSSCGSAPKDVRYYQVVTESQQGAPAGELVIGVEPFYADGPYNDQRIVYRESDYKLDYYYYHRWAAPPGLLVSDFFRSSLQSSGKFGSVISGFTADAVVMVGGRIVGFEEIDHEGDDWSAFVALEVYVRDSRSGQLLWSHLYQEKEPAQDKTPEGVAKAMSTALGRIADEAAPAIGRLAASAATERREAPPADVDEAEPE